MVTPASAAAMHDCTLTGRDLAADAVLAVTGRADGRPWPKSMPKRLRPPPATKPGRRWRLSSKCCWGRRNTPRIRRCWIVAPYLAALVHRRIVNGQDG